MSVYKGFLNPQQAPDGSTVATPPAGYTVPFYGTDGNSYVKLPDGSVVLLAYTEKVLATIFYQTQRVTLANSAAETTLLGTGVGSLLLPAGFWIPGATVEFEAWGFYSTTGSPKIEHKIKLNSTVMLDTGLNSAGSASNSQFRLRGMLTCITVGATGTIECQGVYETDAGDFPMVNSSGPVVVDTTVDTTIDWTGQWDTASVSDTITSTNFGSKYARYV